MNALAMLFALAAGPGVYEETPLPRSLADSLGTFEETELPRSLADAYVMSAPAAEKADLHWWVGGHLGIAAGYNGRTFFVIGGQGRVHILSWLGAEASLDFDILLSAGSGVVIPLEFVALFYPPLEGNFRPYGLAGFGMAFNTGFGGGVFGMFIIGFGAEYEFQPNMMFDVNMRFSFGDFEVFQLLFGVKFKLGN